MAPESSAAELSNRLHLHSETKEEEGVLLSSCTMASFIDSQREGHLHTSFGSLAWAFLSPHIHFFLASQVPQLSAKF